MYEGKSSRLFAKYAVPQMIGLLCNSVYLIVDGVFIGNCLGRDAMAAAAVAVPLVEMMIALSMAVATGAGILVSGCLGRSQRDGAVCAFNLAFWLCGGMGLLLAVLGNVFIHPLARLFGSTEEIHGMAVEYIRYIVTLSPFLLYSFLLSGLARNDGARSLQWLRWPSDRRRTSCWTMYLWFHWIWGLAARRSPRPSGRCSAY